MPTDPFQVLLTAGMPLPPTQFGSLGTTLSRALAPYYASQATLEPFQPGPYATPLTNWALQQYAPFTEGQIGYSPLTQAALDAFQQQTLPVIQQQFELQGLGRSPALGVATGQALATALPPFISQDIQNRLAAAQAITGAGAEDVQRQYAATVTDLQNRLAATGFIPQAEQLVQQAAMNTAQVAQAEQARQLQALGLAGQLTTGLAPLLGSAAQLQQAQQQLALQAWGQGGQEQAQTAQGLLDARQMELLRQQALTEAGTLGLFGSAVIPPTVAGKSITTGGK